MTNQKIILFDTCVFIHFWHGRTEAATWIEKIKSKEIIGGVSPITDFELWKVDLRPGEEKRQRILISRFRRLNFHTTIARESGILIRPFLSNPIGATFLRDCFIAATALYYHTDILTNNKKDFLRLNLPNVNIIDYMEIGPPE